MLQVLFSLCFWELLQERANLEKEVARLRAREAGLVQQLQQAIVDVPVTVPAVAEVEVKSVRSLRSFLPSSPRKPSYLTLAVAALGGLLLASVAAHFKWHKTPMPQSKPKGPRASRVFRRVKNGIHLRWKEKTLSAELLKALKNIVSKCMLLIRF